MSEKVKDPVCGMEVNKDDALRSRYEDRDYYFCSSSCKTEFEASHSPRPEHKKGHGCC